MTFDKRIRVQVPNQTSISEPSIPFIGSSLVERRHVNPMMSVSASKSIDTTSGQIQSQANWKSLAHSQKFPPQGQPHVQAEGVFRASGKETEPSGRGRSPKGMPLATPADSSTPDKGNQILNKNDKSQWSSKESTATQPSSSVSSRLSQLSTSCPEPPWLPASQPSFLFDVTRSQGEAVNNSVQKSELEQPILGPLVTDKKVLQDHYSADLASTFNPASRGSVKREGIENKGVSLANTLQSQTLSSTNTAAGANSFYQESTSDIQREQVGQVNWKLPFTPPTKMETLTESGVLPHKHRPNPGYYAKQDVPGNYFFPGTTSSPHGYPGFMRGGNIGGARGDADEPRDMPYSNQRFPSRNEMGRDGVPSSDYLGVPSQAPSIMTPFRQQHTPPHRMHRFPKPMGDDERTVPRERGLDTCTDTQGKVDLSSSQEREPGFPGAKSTPDVVTSPKKSSFEETHAHMTPFLQKGDRPGSYPSDERHPANFGQSVYPEMRESVKSVFDPYDNERQGGNDKLEAVPVAYDDGDNSEAGTSNRHHQQQQLRDKLDRSTSHEAAVSLWNQPMSQEYGHVSSSEPRPRAMTIDSSMHNRRETDPSSHYGIPLYPGRNTENMFNRMREQFNQYANLKNTYLYSDRDRDRVSPLYASMANAYRRSSGGDGRSSRQEMLNRMMMMSPEKLPKEALSPYPQSSHSLQLPHRQQDSFGRAQPRVPTSPGVIVSHDPEDSLNSPVKSMMPSEHQSHPSIPKDSSPFGGKTATGLPTNSLGPGAGTNDEEKRPSSPQSSHQAISTASPKIISPVLASRFEANGDNNFGTNVSPKAGSQESFSISKETSLEDSSYGSGLKKNDSLKTTPPASYPYMGPADERPSLNSSGIFSADSMDNSRSELSSRNGMMPKKEIMSDDAEDDSYPGACSSPTQHSPRSTSFSYPAFPQQPFFPSSIRAPTQTHPFMSHRGPQDHMPGAPAFPFGKDLASRFQLPGMSPEMPMPSRMGPGPSFMGAMPPSMADDKDVYFCHLCSYSGKSKPEFDSHMGIHFEYNCPHCDYTSRTEGRLKRHIKDFHTDESGRRSMPGRPKVFKCKQCSFSATEKDKFWEHARSHIKEDKLLQCPKCPFVTEYKHHLEYHLRNHFGSKPFKCNKCNYSCVNKSMLNSHMKSHTNVYQYRCSDCTYATKYCHSLKLHLRKYNHKPATVLNQDGSLPQGLDVDASGLSVVAKRGPPRGPRGPRKDKNDPYFGSMYSMPPIPMGMPPNINPMLKGMMPFWPMIPQSGIPGPQGHPGMLPGISSLAHHMSSGFEEESDGHERSGMENNSGDNNESFSDESDPIKEDEDDEKRPMTLPCSLCDFIGDSTESLCLHLLQVHKDKTGEMAKMYGISESALGEIVERAKRRKERRVSEPSLDCSEQESSSNEFHRRNTIAGLLSRGDYQGHESEKDEGNNKSLPSWASDFTSEARNTYQGRDINYGNGGKHSVEDPNGGMDILQQMTLKFGDGTMTERRGTSEKVETNMNEEKDKQRDEATRPTGRRPLKETPLDLTKPKSVSPPMFSNPSSPKRDDDEDEDSTMPWMDEGKQGDLSSITEKLYRKRQLSDIEETPVSSAPETSTMVPRKRSRKGKAYKLDTICLKLQERQSRSPVDSDDTESDLDMNFERFQALQPQSTSDPVEDKTADEEDGITPNSSQPGEDHNSDEDNTNLPVDKGEKEENDTLINSEENDEIKTVEDADESVVASTENTFNEQETDKDDIDDVDNTQANQMETDSTKETDSCVKEEHLEDDAENEFKKLQHTLSILNNEMEEVKNPLEKDDKDCDNDVEDDDDDKTVDNDDYETSISRAEDVSEQTSRMESIQIDCRASFDQSDKENSNDGLILDNEPPASPGKADIEEKVDMINTVLENRKKPLPPAVRRGTELAWKLLNDPVNPVTSIPIPVESQPAGPKSQQTLPIASGSSAVPGPMPNNGPSMIRNGFTIAPSPAQPLLPLKSPLPVPLPATPMAFIPPTNRMMPEAPMPRLPPTPPKPMPKDMYECTYCDLSFRDCVMYTVHMGYHSNRNPFKCNSCGIICRDKVEFFLHIARSPHS